MKTIVVAIISAFLLFCSPFALAQQTAAASASNAVVPPLVKFSGTLSDLNGRHLTGVVGVTFALYKEQQGGTPLWLETQNVKLDSSGHYSIMLGSTSSTGLPAEIFAGGEARWLGVHPQSQEGEQPRVLLLSVPYALKAGDAQTLGGLPSSAFVLAAPPVGGSSSSNSAPPAHLEVAAPTPIEVTTSGGTANTIPLFTSSNTVANSILTQNGTAAINLAGKLVLPATGTATATSGANSEPVMMTGSAFNSTSSVAANQKFQWQVEPAANNTATPSGTLNLLFGSGTAAPADTGLKIDSTGKISFAAGQAFPGTITAITAGADLSGGGTSGKITLNLNTTATDKRYAQLATNNTYTGTQTINNTVTMVGNSPSGILQVTNTVPSGTGPAIVGTTDSAAAAGIKGIVNATTGTEAGVVGQTFSTAGYGVYGSGPNVGVYGFGNIGLDAHGSLVGVKGVATVAGGTSGLFSGGPVSVNGNGINALIGDPGCGSGYAGIGVSTGSLSGCTNYAVIGGPKGDTYVNSSQNGWIHFRSSNNELATVDNSGNVKVIGINGGGNLSVAGKVTSSNVTAQATASNPTAASSCSGTLSAPNAGCAVPNLTLTETTNNPNVLVMVNIGGVSTDPCVIANFYLIIDSRIAALSSVSFNTNNNTPGTEYGNVTIISLQNLAAGSHTYQVEQASDHSSSGCSSFISGTFISQGDGGRGSQRSLIVREF